MAERLRPVQMKFYVTEEEKNFIYKKMSLIGVKNLSAYLRKMAIDGQLVRIETTDLDEICRQISGIAKNINQIAKRINATDNIFPDDIREMKKKVEEVWQLLKSTLSPHYFKQGSRLYYESEENG